MAEKKQQTIETYDELPEGVKFAGPEEDITTLETYDELPPDVKFAGPEETVTQEQSLGYMDELPPDVKFADEKEEEVKYRQPGDSAADTALRIMQTEEYGGDPILDSEIKNISKAMGVSEEFVREQIPWAMGQTEEQAKPGFSWTGWRKKDPKP